MTNFEYWKDKILGFVENGKDFGVIDNKPRSCDDIDDDGLCGGFGGGKCAFLDDRDTCSVCRIKWLYVEHIDIPTLTKKERMFCEGVGEGYIAMDDDESLWYYIYEPRRTSNGRGWCGDNNNTICLDGLKLTFKFIKPTDEKPWNIEELLKLEVKNEVED